MADLFNTVQHTLTSYGWYYASYLMHHPAFFLLLWDIGSQNTNPRRMISSSNFIRAEVTYSLKITSLCSLQLVN